MCGRPSASQAAWLVGSGGGGGVGGGDGGGGCGGGTSAASGSSSSALLTAACACTDASEHRASTCAASTGDAVSEQRLHVHLQHTADERDAVQPPHAP